jgi:hypothetical protein
VLRGFPFTTAGFAHMVERAAAAAGIKLKAHPHMLRHACGYAAAAMPVICSAAFAALFMVVERPF